MKRFLATALACAVLGCNVSWAQWTQSNGPDGGPVTQVFVNSSNSYAFAIGNGGLFRSTNGGASWTPLLASPMTGGFAASVITSVGTNTWVYGLNNQLGVAEFYHSTNYGDTWTKKAFAGVPFTAFFRNLWAAGPNLLAGTSNAAVYKSTDDGASWTASSTGMTATADIAYFATKGTDVYAATSLVASFDTVYRSTNNGANWTATTFFTGKKDYITANAGAVFVSTTTNGVHRSTDNGATWTKINPVSPAGLNFPGCVLATSTNLFIGYGDVVYRAGSTGAAPWDSLANGFDHPGAASQAIRSMAQSGTTILAANNGLGSGTGIHRSTNNGDLWVRANAGLRALKINGLLAVGTDVYAAGDAQGFFRTSDFGATWTEINNGITWNAGWYCFAQVGAEILGGTSLGEVYRSSNRGDTWTLSNTGFTLTNTFDFFVEGNLVYATGYAGIAKSTDGGLSWGALPAGFSLGQTGLSIWKIGTNMLCGTNATLKRSINSGDTWDASVTGVPGAGGFGGFAQTDSFLFVVGALGVYRSADSGATWIATNTGVAGSGRALASYGTDLYVGTTLGVYKSTDQGDTWNPENGGLPATAIGAYKFAVTSNPHLFLGNDRFSTFNLDLGPVAVTEVGGTLPENLTLAQNYPNPFNAGTRIDFSIHQPADVKLEIFNVLGQNVRTLVQGAFTPGNYQVNWDGTDQSGRPVPSGMYLYRLKAGDLVESKKMNLLK